MCVVMMYQYFSRLYGDIILENVARRLKTKLLAVMKGGNNLKIPPHKNGCSTVDVEAGAGCSIRSEAGDRRGVQLQRTYHTVRHGGSFPQTKRFRVRKRLSSKLVFMTQICKVLVLVNGDCLSDQYSLLKNASPGKV